MMQQFRDEGVSKVLLPLLLSTVSCQRTFRLFWYTYKTRISMGGKAGRTPSESAFELLHGSTSINWFSVAR